MMAYSHGVGGHTVLAMNGGIMGLLSKLFGGVDKSALIKDLVHLRIRSDPMASAMGFDEGMVNSLSTFQLAGLPEGTIVTIVETWTKLRKYGAPDPDIFRRIEDHRSMAFPRGEMPSPLNLTSYIRYRLDIEHSQGAPLDDDFVESAIEIARKAYEA